MADRCRKYLITINNPKDRQIDKEYIETALSRFDVKYFCGCTEVGEAGTPHIHLYIYFNNAIQFSTLKKLFKNSHIDAVRGSSIDNRNYVLKAAPEHNKKADGSYEYKDSTGKTHTGINFSDTYFDNGQPCPEEHSGKRNDLIAMYDLVKDGYTNAEIIEQIGETAILHVDKLNKLRHTYLIDKYRGTRRLDIKVHYITGKTGTGKSRGVLDEFGDESCYRVTDYQHPFDSYQSEPVIIFEEFRSSLRLSDMLNYLDVYPCILPARYSPKVACYNEVFVISNWSFEMQYSELQKDTEQTASYEAWVRRYNGYVREYYDIGKYKEYPSMQDYLNRHNNFTAISDSEKDNCPFI